MSKKNNQHPNKRLPSDRDIVTLCAAVVHDYNSLLRIHRRVRDTDIYVSDELQKTIKMVWKLHARYERGDFRHTLSEKSALRELAQWNVNMNSELRRQEQTPVVTWKD